MGAKGVAILDFGTTPTAEGSVTVTGQTAIAADSKVEAFIMRDSTADSSTDEHETLAAYGQIVCGDIVPGTGFTARINLLAGLAIGQFNLHWVWD